MTTPCHFNSAQLSFEGSPLDQARCLLRTVKPHGIVAEAPADLPPVLSSLLASPAALGVTKAQLRSFLQTQGIAESTVGGSVTDRICHANSDDPNAPLARYFVIHDTSFKLGAGQDFDPDFINTAAWSGNKLSGLPDGKTHIYITRLGETRTDRTYGTPWRATQFEKPSTRFRGLFLHHELVQPRMGPGTQDFQSPDPGFTPAQYARLALQYVIAGVRRGEWMVPVYHCVLDLGVGDHDDPQHFDLAAWDAALQTTLAGVRAEQAEADVAVIAAAPTAPRARRTRPRKAGRTRTAKKAAPRRKVAVARKPAKKTSAKKKSPAKSPAKPPAKSRKTAAAVKKAGKKTAKTRARKSKKRA
ncbi:hypothetical protein ACVIW2_001349 [Bradyrhizobium huanghuaihaiense]|uniref:Uncharacterized protein n=1 Tax=Bradyrhizobium huanghuaihaiense TaxID=990078 RepID=A0A562RJN8_9BRAD|nr:hypothetical protein [Bradyrhizobium huanghuaihaiense]TWI68794.1 hypothetical protein IQ16_03987 [Bradyrhizobium huanghuaihaiense]